MADIIAAATGAANLGVDFFNFFNQGSQNELNREREDTAVQRRVADLKAAGLSPTLAAGSPASSAVMSAPQANFDNVDPLQKMAAVQALKATSASITKTQSETALIDQQRRQGLSDWQWHIDNDLPGNASPSEWQKIWATLKPFMDTFFGGKQDVFSKLWNEIQASTSPGLGQVKLSQHAKDVQQQDRTRKGSNESRKQAGYK